MATSTLGSGTLVLAGTTSGTTTVTATAVAGTTTLTLPAATDTLVGRATTDTLTNKTLTGAAMNGTVGATTPSTGAFTTLSATGASSFATSSGDVGIGTSSPAYKLDVLGSTGSSVIASFRSGETTTTQRAGAGFQTIGSATAASRSARMWLDADGGDFAGSDYFYIDKVGSSGEVAFIQQSNAAMTFHTNATKQMTIDSSGNLLVGTTSTVGSARVAIVTSGSTSATRAINLQNSGSTNLLIVLNDGQVYANEIGSDTGTALVLNSNGYIKKLTSSIRYKKDVEPIDIGLDFVMGLSPVKYNMKNGDTAQVGFIAEDFPDDRFVSKSMIDAQDVSKGFQVESVNYANITAPLVKAIQEQQALITQLTARITALESA